MTRQRCVLLATLVVLGFVGFGPAPGPAGEGKGPAAAGDFSGKLVIVTYNRGDTQASAVLEKAQVRRLGDRPFLVGVGVDEWSPDKWAHGLTHWVPMDRVTSITEVADVEQAKKVFGSVGK
jgi:hypothetical protein